MLVFMHVLHCNLVAARTCTVSTTSPPHMHSTTTTGSPQTATLLNTASSQLWQLIACSFEDCEI